MQGSPCSNIILAYLLRTMPQLDPVDGVKLLFGDDLVVLTRENALLEILDETLPEYFADPALGPLTLLKTNTNSSNRFEYLGYDFSSNWDGSWEVGLSQKNWSRLEAVRDRELLKRTPLASRFENIQIRRTLMGILTSHPHLSDPQAIIDALMTADWDDARTQQIISSHQRSNRRPLLIQPR